MKYLFLENSFMITENAAINKVVGLLQKVG
jgi:hypothetical protein